MILLNFTTDHQFQCRFGAPSIDVTLIQSTGADRCDEIRPLSDLRLAVDCLLAGVIHRPLEEPWGTSQFHSASSASLAG